MNKKNISVAFPPFIYLPKMLVWVNILPQTMLLLLNLRVFWIVCKEEGVDLAQVWFLLAFQLFLIAASFVVWRWSNVKKFLPASAMIFLLLGQIGYLWAFMYKQQFFIPWRIEPWIINQELVNLNQFAMMMPGIFYAILRLSSFRWKVPFAMDLGISLSTIVGVPILFFIFLQLFNVFWILPQSSAFSWFYQIFFIVGTIIVFLALVRVTVLLFYLIQQKVWSKNLDILFAFFVGVLGPIGGLCLNKNIPFPADFQSPYIYALAFINGCILMIPVLKNKNGRLVTLYFRTLFYPFTCYFFVVFLPFLPLSIPSIIAMGLGFLILVPFVLWIIHTKRIHDDIQLLKVQMPMQRIVILMIAALVIMPGIFFNNAFHDRKSLHQAIDYVYQPDYQKDVHFDGSANNVKRTLVKLNKMKRGAQLPYLSSVYNTIVFDGMVLPDRKISYLHQLFSGEKLQEFPYGGASFWGRGGQWRGRRQRVAEMTLGELMAKPDEEPRVSEVTLLDLETSQHVLGQMMSTTVHFKMKNGTQSDNAEYFTTIHLPKGVLIKDYHLKVGDEMVPGRIFEKKTAMWVYHMIRDFTRRDPGILVYQSPQDIDFRVYPFLRSELREASLTLLYPKDINPIITVADRELSLQSQAPALTDAVLINQPSGAYDFSFISAKRIAELPAFKREPYFHFILDYSLSGYDSAEDYAQQIDLIFKQFPQIKQMAVTAAHFDIETLLDDPLPVQAIAQRDQALRRCRLKKKGSLDLNRVLKKIFLDYELKLTTAKNSSHPGLWNKYPVFVVLSKRPQDVLFVHDNLAYYDYLLPEQNYFYINQLGTPLKRVNLWRKRPFREQQDVVALRRGTRVTVIPKNFDQPQFAFHLTKDHNQQSAWLEVFDSGQNDFISINGAKKIPADQIYTKGIESVLDSYISVQHPKDIQLPRQILEQSRKLNILTPLTSFIVVERDSQWKTLELKEKQKMRSHQAFDFEDDFDTPTPSFLYLVICLLGFHFVIKIVSKKINTV
ncbi:MAG: MSEP-CTERM sorting domain-containing protein [Candidatus Omnitrophica bacterium]|nr:MSEP-CTERM sorting domain-containing protein [Candidatus Omnitrophota bacterium]